MKCAIVVVLICAWTYKVSSFESSDQQSHGIFMEQSRNDLNTAASGYIYRQDGRGPASIVYLDPSQFNGLFSEAKVSGYPFANVAQLPLSHDNSGKYYTPYTPHRSNLAQSTSPKVQSYLNYPHLEHHQPHIYKSVILSNGAPLIQHPVNQNRNVPQSAYKVAPPTPVVYNNYGPHRHESIIQKQPIVHHHVPIVQQHKPIIHHQAPPQTQNNDEDDDNDDEDDDDDDDKDHQELASYDHNRVLGHVGQGSHGNQDSHYKKNEGKEQGEEHARKHGHKGNEGYEKQHEYSKGEKGSHDSAYHEGHYDQNGGHKKSEYDEADESGAHKKGEKGSKGGKFGERKHHKKGSKTTGYHNVFHKDEYKKDHTFYDEADHRGHFDKHGNEESYHQNDEAATKKGGHHDSAHQNDKFSKKGHTDKGMFDKAFKGYKNNHVAEEHHAHEEEYGQKGGKNQGSEHMYATHH